MALRQFNPVTASLRGTVLIDRSDLWKGGPVKGLTEGQHSHGGRNNHGRITTRFRGGGHKQSYRLVDFRRRKFNVAATVERLEYDPNRTAFLALIKYADNELAYILAPQRLKVGDTVISGARVDIKPGNAMPMSAIPVGTIIHNVEMKIGAGGKIARSAGTYAQLVGKDAGYAQIKLTSGELRVVRAECMASIGAVSNPDNMNQKIGKAGRSRWLSAPARTCCRNSSSAGSAATFPRANQPPHNSGLQSALILDEWPQVAHASVEPQRVHARFAARV